MRGLAAEGIAYRPLVWTAWGRPDDDAAAAVASLTGGNDDSGGGGGDGGTPAPPLLRLAKTLDECHNITLIVTMLRHNITSRVVMARAGRMGE